MGNSRNLANLLGTGSTIATAKIADDAITAAKIATDAVVADGLSSSAIAAGDLPTGTIIQMVFDTYGASEQATSSTTFQRITGHELDLTFKSANSTILIGNNAPSAMRGAAVSFNLFAQHNGTGTWYNLATNTSNSALGISGSIYGLATNWDTGSTDQWVSITQFWGGNLPFTHAVGDTVKVQPAVRRGGPGTDSENDTGSYSYSHDYYTNQLWMMEVAS